MNIDPRILDAIIGFIVQALLFGGAIFIFLPKLMDTKLQEHSREIDLRYKERLQVLDEKATDSQIKSAEAAAQQVVLQGLVDNTGDLVKSISVMARNTISDLSERVEMRKTVSANTEALTSQVEAIGEFGTTLNNLLDTGSKPLQEANNKLDKLVLSVLEVKTTQAESATKLESILSKIAELQLTLSITKRVAEEKLQEVKEATAEVKAVIVPSEP